MKWGRLHLFVVKYNKNFAKNVSYAEWIYGICGHFITAISAREALIYEISSSGLILNWRPLTPALM